MQFSISKRDFRPRAVQVAVRFRADDLEKLKRKARSLRVGHTTLIRTVVEKWLKVER